MNDNRLQTIIDQIDQGKVPKAKDKQEQEHINLLLSLKSANQEQLNPDDKFINHLESKIMKGGRMSFQLSKYFKLPYIVGFAVVVLLLVGVSNSFYIPSPFSLMQGRGSMMDYDYSMSKGESAGYGSGIAINSAPAVEEPSMGMGMARDESSVVESKGMMIEPDIMPYPYPGGYEDVITTDRSIVSSADLSITSEDVKGAIDEATTYVESINGYITNSSLNKTDDGYVAYLTMRIPSENFQAAIQNFRRMGVEVTYENVNSYDQTNQVVSVDDQISELNDQLEEYQLLLKDAETSQEKLRYQQMISNLERQIKSYEKQAQNLQAREKMSTISLSIAEDKFKIPFLENMGLDNIFRDAAKTLAKLVALVLVLVIWVVVLTPIWLPVVLIMKWIKKRKK